MSKKNVKIEVVGSQINVDPDPVHISQANSDTVEWKCATHDWVVSFPVSPFNSPFFGKPKGHPEDSGPARPGTGGRYHYRVRVRFDDGEIRELDPDVVVDI